MVCSIFPLRSDSGGWHGLHNPSGCECARRSIRTRAQNKTKGAAGRGRVREPPYRHGVDRAANFPDHDANRAAAQCFLHGPQHIACAAGRDHEQILRSYSRLIETGCVKRAILRERESFSDPEHTLSGERTRAQLLSERLLRSLPPCGGGTGRGVSGIAVSCCYPPPQPSPTRGEGAGRVCGSRVLLYGDSFPKRPSDQTQGEAVSGCNRALAHRRNLMQRATREPAAQCIVDLGNTKLDGSNPFVNHAGGAFKQGKRMAQRVDAHRYRFGGRARGSWLGMHISGSLFVLIDSAA